MFIRDPCETKGCYGSNAFRALCGDQGVRQCFTRPYTPRTNGKAERFIQTLLRRWAYRRPYRTSVFRTAAPRPWLKHYNHPPGSLPDTTTDRLVLHSESQSGHG